MSTLIGTVGLPCSGKTTWARGLGPEPWPAAPIVSPDELRWAIYDRRYWQPGEPLVWATAHAMVPALFRAGHEVVVLDATNTTRKRRREWEDPRWSTIWRVMDTRYYVCLDRAKRLEDQEILPVLHRMHDQFEPLQDGELELGVDVSEKELFPWL